MFGVTRREGRSIPCGKEKRLRSRNVRLRGCVTEPCDSEKCPSPGPARGYGERGNDSLTARLSSLDSLTDSLT